MRHELVVAEVGRREEIAVTREEAQEAFQHLAQGGMEPPEDEASRARMIENLRDSIYERKVLNLLADRADVQVIEGARGKSRIVTPFDS
jgi:FKBP-type peptidyl-prolyl cis-trans isomerase (trigger factor)